MTVPQSSSSFSSALSTTTCAHIPVYLYKSFTTHPTPFTPPRFIELYLCCAQWPDIFSSSCPSPLSSPLHPYSVHPLPTWQFILAHPHLWSHIARLEQNSALSLTSDFDSLLHLVSEWSLRTSFMVSRPHPHPHTLRNILHHPHSSPDWFAPMWQSGMFRCFQLVFMVTWCFHTHTPPKHPPNCPHAHIPHLWLSCSCVVVRDCSMITSFSSWWASSWAASLYWARESVSSVFRWLVSVCSSKIWKWGRDDYHYNQDNLYTIFCRRCIIAIMRNKILHQGSA